MNMTLLSRSALLAGGILALFTVGCGDSKGVAVPDSQETAIRIDNLRITIEGKEVYYSEFALPGQAMSEWNLEGWNVVEKSLQNRNFSCQKYPMAVELWDKFENTVVLEEFTACSTDLHQHVIEFMHTVTPSHVALRVGEDTALLQIEPVSGKQYLRFTLEFDCRSAGYVEPTEEPELIELFPGINNPSVPELPLYPARI
jgi:hypothetical protein